MIILYKNTKINFTKKGGQMNIFFVVIWMVLGFILAIPYTWLAGGIGDGVVAVIFFGPPIGLFLLGLFCAAKRLAGRRKKVVFAIFWGLVVLFNLPIILRLTSVGLRALEYKATADFVFKYRYLSIGAVLVAGFLTLIAVIYIQEKAGKFTKKLIP